MDLRRQINIVRHWLWLIVLSVILASVAAYVISNSLPKVYEARTTLIVGQSLSSVDPNLNQILASQRLSQTFAQLATTTPVLGNVVNRLGLSIRPDELRNSVLASAQRDSTLLTIVASQGDPALAAAVANAVATELIAASPAVQGQGQVENAQSLAEQLAGTLRQIAQAQEELDALLVLDGRTPEQDERVDVLQDRLVSLRQTYGQVIALSPGSASNLLTVVDPAVAALEPSAPRVLLNTLMAALLGLMVALGLAFVIEYLDDTVKSPDDVSATGGVPTLGVVSQMKWDRNQSEHQRLATVVAPRSPVAEAFRTLRTNLEFASVDKALGSLLVTSALPGEGKSTVSANVAITFAQAGRRVILLDGDMRRPSLHRIFEVPNSHGLTTLLRDDNAALSSIAHHTEERNLRLITTGPLPPNPAELLGSNRMRELLVQLSGEADLIVVDSPPLHAVTDAAVLAAEVDGTLLVIHAGRTRRGAVAQAREALDKVGANILGAALNRLTERSARGYYYRYYRDYYAAAEPAEADAPRKKAAGPASGH